jgi:hypothetical protein
LEDHIHTKTVKTQLVASNQEIRENITSNRLRKTQVTKRDDFFMVIHNYEVDDKFKIRHCN